ADLSLPEVQPGSSIMPGKVNPVIAESLIQVGAQVIGNDAAVSVAAQGSFFELNMMMPVAGHNAGAAIAKEAAASGRTIREVAAEKTELTPEELERILDPAAMTEP